MEAEEVGEVHGLGEDHLASYHRGKDQGGFSAEVPAGGFSAHGDGCGLTSALVSRTTTLTPGTPECGHGTAMAGA